jgi:predicted ATPase/DNA-binding winged helix-turn-helix (wHTH) protein
MMNIFESTPRQLPPSAERPRPRRSHSHSSFEADGHVGNAHVDRRFSAEADRINGSAGSAICFGSFRLLPARRLLLEGDKPLRLGSRALDILIALVERPGELVRKEELMARVWPNTFVESANLTVHIAALRRTLGDGRGGNRFLINIPGRGYRFVAPIKVSKELEFSPPQFLAVEHVPNLPATVTRLIGREKVVVGLSAQLSRLRFFTIVGPGGIGKTSVALAVAAGLIPKYAHGICVADLGALDDPRLVPGAVAGALGLQHPSEYPLAGLTAALTEKQMLLLLDNCEHLIDAAAELAVDVMRLAPGVQILATSREPLRVKGEHVHRLSQLESPPASVPLTAAEALVFPAVRLFVERAAATLSEFELDDADAPIVANICQRLDGVPLAIELAAFRVGAFGVRGVAARMENRLTLLTGGHRTSPLRQQTMRASLEWSYGLLSELERLILRRLSVFDDTFTLRAAGQVAADTRHSENEFIDIVLGLVAKSLIIVCIRGAEPRLRLLETTRAFGRTKLAGSSECDTFYRRRAAYDRDWLESPGQEDAAAPYWSADNADEIDNVRVLASRHSDVTVQVESTT